ncbi:DEAD/DEAH box helicase [Candidatus Latescibacterota bacterium]
MTDTGPDLLGRFIATFKRAVTAEMEAMRQRLGPFEVPLTGGRRQEGSGGDGPWLYVFRVLQANDKLVVNGECTLVTGTWEGLVTIVSLEGDEVCLRSDRPVELGDAAATLVIYPWFLYERLRAALQELLDDDTFHTGNALALFGRGPVRSLSVDPGRIGLPPELNGSQQRAVSLCCTHTPTFVWGPPGTGKTYTLGHIVTALLGLGQRVLVTSTTNAAVDQALGKLMELEQGQLALERGEVVRIGQGQAEDFGASLRQVVERLNARVREQLASLHERRRQAQEQARTCASMLETLDAEAQPQQLGFFEEVPHSTLEERQLQTVFSTGRAASILASPLEDQRRTIQGRRKRLEACLRLLKERVADLNGQLRREEANVVKGARVVLATMTNVYVNALLQRERFDTVIVEEAGMAVLPTLFYCASLSRDRLVMVGDPQQLPPIVQSSHAYVQRAMGRSIFEVTVPEPHASDLVVMLDTQYRMHPDIGDLVGDLFYGGRLRHGEGTAERAAIAAREPYPGAAIVVVDTGGETTCATREGSYSRYNEQSAQACVDLALAAVRDGVTSVAVITPYVEQSRLIRQLLPKDSGIRDQVECRTVHRFQGGERDMVILDTVDAVPLSPGVLLAGGSPGASADNLINVSISRARGKLIIVADVEYFRSRAPDGAVTRMLDRAMEMMETGLTTGLFLRSA